jgi:hypothetical protein
LGIGNSPVRQFASSPVHQITNEKEFLADLRGFFSLIRAEVLQMFPDLRKSAD